MKKKDMQKNYYARYPSTDGSKIVFISEEDLWEVPFSGGKAYRLTNCGNIHHFTACSRDGNYIAFCKYESSGYDLYLLEYKTGKINRLTYWYSDFTILGFTNDSKWLLVTTNYGNPFQQLYALKAYDIQSMEISEYTVTNIYYADIFEDKTYSTFQELFENSDCLIQSMQHDPAYWKNYKGGMCANFFLKQKKGKEADYSSFFDTKTINKSYPMRIGNSIYFLSDQNSISGIYQTDISGTTSKLCLEHSDFYIRNPSKYNEYILYSSGGDVFIYDTAANTTSKINIVYSSSRKGREVKSIDPLMHFQDYDFSSNGLYSVFSIRGKLAVIQFSDNAVTYLPNKDGVRYLYPTFIENAKSLFCIDDESGEYVPSIYSVESGLLVKQGKFQMPGNILSLKANQTDIVFSTHKHELYCLSNDLKNYMKLDYSEFSEITDFDIHPKRSLIAYAKPVSYRNNILVLMDYKNRDNLQISCIPGNISEISFSNDGSFLFICATANYDPVFDTVLFDIGFPMAYKLYCINLQNSLKNPFASTTLKGQNERKASFQELKDTIEHRIYDFPLSGGVYEKIQGNREKLYYLAYSVISEFEETEKAYSPDLLCFDFKEKKSKLVETGVFDYILSSKSNELFIVKSDGIKKLSGFTENDTEEVYKTVSLDALVLSVDLKKEYTQMFREVWRLQRDQFYDENKIKNLWLNVYNKYYALVDRINTRLEFSDMIQEMQGELQTSHTFEFPPKEMEDIVQASLGLDVTYDKSNGCCIKKIYRGYPHSSNTRSPFLGVAPEISAGDKITGIDNISLSKDLPLETALLKKANKFVRVYFTHGSKKKMVEVKALISDNYLRYHDWALTNQNKTHSLSNNRIGYIHIPDMTEFGYSLFVKQFILENSYKGLIIDIRYNSGGFASEFILDKLMKKKLGVEIRRFSKNTEPYPFDAAPNCQALLVNEHTGSDGDIFAHAFSMLHLGKIIGKRTWGGTIGIEFDNYLIDGGITTQPKLAFNFKDIGLRLENYGVEPDIEIDNLPCIRGTEKDEQLHHAVSFLLKEI